MGAARADVHVHAASPYPQSRRPASGGGNGSAASFRFVCATAFVYETVCSNAFRILPGGTFMNVTLHNAACYFFSFNTPIGYRFSLRNCCVVVEKRSGTRQSCPFLESSWSVQSRLWSIPLMRVWWGRVQGGVSGEVIKARTRPLYELPSTHLPIRPSSPHDHPPRPPKQWLKQRRQHWSCKINNGVSGESSLS